MRLGITAVGHHTQDMARPGHASRGPLGLCNNYHCNVAVAGSHAVYRENVFRTSGKFGLFNMQASGTSSASDGGATSPQRYLASRTHKFMPISFFFAASTVMR